MLVFQTLLSPTTSRLVNIDQVALLSGVFKVLFLLSVVFYMVFAVIVIRQVQIMKNTLITPVSPLIMLLSIIHLALTVVIFLLFMVML